MGLVMFGFACAFCALFRQDQDHPQFATIGQSMLTVFRYALGGADLGLMENSHNPAAVSGLRDAGWLRLECWAWSAGCRVLAARACSRGARRLPTHSPGCRSPTELSRRLHIFLHSQALVICICYQFVVAMVLMSLLVGIMTNAIGKVGSAPRPGVGSCCCCSAGHHSAACLP
jgi:hypothetical protein